VRSGPLSCVAAKQRDAGALLLWAKLGPACICLVMLLLHMRAPSSKKKSGISCLFLDAWPLDEAYAGGVGRSAVADGEGGRALRRGSKDGRTWSERKGVGTRWIGVVSNVAPGLHPTARGACLKNGAQWLDYLARWRNLDATGFWTSRRTVFVTVASLCSPSSNC